VKSMANLEITGFEFVDDSLRVRFMSEFVMDETLTFYLDQPGGILRCENKHMSREFVKSVLAKAGDLLILDGIGD